MMSTVSDRIRYLVRRKFDLALTALGDLPAKDRDTYFSGAKAYKTELLGMTNEELRELFDQEQAKHGNEQRAEAEKEEETRFFKKPEATADFSHWSKMPYWTLDEALTLSLGRSPDVVTPQLVQPYAKVSSFADQYMKVHELIRRANEYSQLTDYPTPPEFVAWAIAKSIELPPELVEQVRARQGITSPKKRLDDAKAQIERQDVAMSEKDQSIARLIEERDGLQRRIAEPSAEAPPLDQKRFSPRERNTLLKIIIGMAVMKYWYDPDEPSEKPKKIAGDVEQLGHSVSAQTVRTKLKEGTALTSPEGLSAARERRRR